MPLLYGQQSGGSWMPQFGAGNWSSQWGQRPGNFQPGQNAYSYFQQNPGQMQNYNSGRLGNAFTSWFGGGQSQGPTGGDPRYPQTPNRPTNPATGNVPSTYGDYLGPAQDVPNVYNPNPNGYGTPTAQASQTVKPGMLGNYGRPNTQQGSPFGGGQPQYPAGKFATPPGIGSFRNGGWF